MFDSVPDSVDSVTDSVDSVSDSVDSVSDSVDSVEHFLNTFLRVTPPPQLAMAMARFFKIGRASCRERV